MGMIRRKNAGNYKYEASRLNSKKCVPGQVVKDRGESYEAGVSSLEGEKENLKQTKETFPDVYFKDCWVICFRC